MTFHPGGKGANQAVAAVLAGASVRLVGAVGNDDYGTLLLQSLLAKGLQINHIHKKEGISGSACITINEAGEIALFCHQVRIRCYQRKTCQVRCGNKLHIGALAAAWLQGLPFSEGVHFASAAAALAVTRDGAQGSIPKLEEIEAFIAKSGPLVPTRLIR